MTSDAGAPPGFAFSEGPIFREADGLACAPVNDSLTPEERRVAAGLFRALLAGQLLHALGETNPAKILKAVRAALEAETLFRVEALAILDAGTHAPVLKKVKSPVVLAAEVSVGAVLLRDCVRFG